MHAAYNWGENFLYIVEFNRRTKALEASQNEYCCVFISMCLAYTSLNAGQ